MRALKTRRGVTTGDLQRLEPHFGDQGLIRVCGLLVHADLSFDQRWPILLPRNDSHQPHSIGCTSQQSRTCRGRTHWQHGEKCTGLQRDAR